MRPPGPVVMRAVSRRACTALAIASIGLCPLLAHLDVKQRHHPSSATALHGNRCNWPCPFCIWLHVKPLLADTLCNKACPQTPYTHVLYILR